MISAADLKKYTLKDFIDWLGISIDDFAHNDEDAIDFINEHQNRSLLEFKNYGFFTQHADAIKDFINDMNMEKLSSITIPFINPITENMENYILDYKDDKYIIIEPREEQDKEFTLELSEQEFIDYLVKKGEDPHTAQELADEVKQEQKMASLLKIAKTEDMAFDTNAHIRVWVDITDLEYETEIENIKKMSGSTLEEKIKLAKEFAKTIALTKIIKGIIDVREQEVLTESFDRIDWVNLLEPEKED